jgi:hypothetical protein
MYRDDDFTVATAIRKKRKTSRVNLELLYKQANILCALIAGFLVLSWISGATSWWAPFVVLAVPTVCMISFLVIAFVVSFFLDVRATL